MTSSIPLVSIIIPCYNAELWVGEALESCIAQTYRPLEIIVIDDGSTDGSLNIIKRYAEQYPNLISYETGPNRGGCAARNRGFALSKGEYVKFFDADDLLEPETIAGAVEVLGGRKDVVAASPWWDLYWTGNQWIKSYRQSSNESDLLIAQLRYFEQIPVQALVWPREMISELEGWDESLSVYQDIDLEIRSILKGYRFVHASQGGCAWRHHSSNSVWQKSDPHAYASKIRVYEKTEATLRQTNRIEKYRLDLARAFHRVASNIMRQNEELGERALRHAVRLGGIRSVQGTLRHRPKLRRLESQSQTLPTRTSSEFGLERYKSTQSGW